jgi:hypothetical protein
VLLEPLPANLAKLSLRARAPQQASQAVGGRPTTQPPPRSRPNSVLERIADEPQHRRPQPNEERAALGVSALALIVCLGPDPQADAQKYRPDRHQMQLPTS